MAHILALSSWVAHGHVGLSTAAPVVQTLGNTITQLPTTLLSNHPGFAHMEGESTEPETLRALIRALDANGWIETADTILTGYIPSAAHVAVAVELIDRFEGGGPRVVVDPVLGDYPNGLYIAQEAAEAVRDHLIPRADILTPNVFELSWLTCQNTRTLDAAAQAACKLVARSEGAEVLVTSAPFEGAKTGVLAVTRSEIAAFQTPRAAQDHLVPHGVGDVFSALVAAGLQTGQALGHLQTLIEHSLGAPHLRIAETADLWTKADPIQATASRALTRAPETG